MIIKEVLYHGWGNKYKLLKDLIPLFPKECDVFVDLFGGSGVVSMNYKGKQATIYNEFNENIVGLIKMIINNIPEQLDKYWKAKVNEYNIKTMKDRKYFENEDKFQEHLKQQEGYYNLRKDYNTSKEKDKRDLYLLTCYSINHLIRFNRNSEFNVSCGNLQEYNDKTYNQVKDMHETFKDVKITCQDALTLDLNQLPHNTFIYCDVPYLNTEAVYNEKRAFGGWTIENDYKMFKLLEEADKKGIKWGLSNVFENRGKKNQHLIDWCEKNGWRVYHLDRNYNPFSRGNSNNDEVYICNYPPQQEQQKQEEVKYKKADLLDI